MLPLAGGGTIDPFSVDFAYLTSAAQTYTIPITGLYKLECWGGKGGDTHYTGGKGGYVSAYMIIKKNSIATIQVGAYGGTGGYKSWSDFYNGGSWTATEHSWNPSNGGSTYISIDDIKILTANGGTASNCYWDDNHGNVDNPSEGGSNGSAGSGSVNVDSSITYNGTTYSSVITSGGNSDKNGKAKISFITK